MRYLLQRLQQALPEVEQWIDELHARHFRASVPASDLEFPRLEAYFPTAMLTAARMVSVDKVPFPPVSAYGLPEFEAMANIPMAAVRARNRYAIH